MKTHLIATIASVVLATTAGVASAAEHSSNMSKSSQPSAMHSMAKQGLSLTRGQQQLALKDLGRTGTTEKQPANFTPTVGATTPNDLTLSPVPANLGRQVSTLKPYDYALLKHELLIVDPTDKKVVDVINRHA
ncbi:MAG TPA: DUF1236 domain-containing protein [Bradyrhizobium sp.]|nr:DUF1236 domain-containing protein [Bradyrhizobium sp.]